MSITFVDKILFQSPVLRLVDIRWFAHERRPTGEGASDFCEITFQRTGMFVKNYGPGGVVCDPNTLLFINADEPYCLSHPVALDCACTALLVHPNVLAGLIKQECGSVADRREGLFPISAAPMKTELAIAHHGLFTLAQAPRAPDPLVFEELGLRLAGRVIADAMQTKPRRSPQRRGSTVRAHRDTAQAVRALLAECYHRRLTLTEIARRVHIAPHHLCHVFREQTGVSIYQYLIRLRLAAALQLMVETDLPLAQLAVQVGFCHHSHFSNVFRQAFGIPAGQARNCLKQASLNQIRTIMQV